MQTLVTGGVSPKNAFAMVFGSRKKFVKQTHSDQLQVLKNIPRVVVEEIIAKQGTWATLRSRSKEYK